MEEPEGGILPSAYKGSRKRKGVPYVSIKGSENPRAAVTERAQVEEDGALCAAELDGQVQPSGLPKVVGSFWVACRV